MGLHPQAGQLPNPDQLTDIPISFNQGLSRKIGEKLGRKKIVMHFSGVVNKVKSI